MIEKTLKLRRRTESQKRISNSHARFNVACWGRQSGKTTFGIDKMTYKPLMGRKGGIYWNVLQTYSAAEIAFERMDRLLFSTGLQRRKANHSDLCQFLQNDANVFFKSGDKPQNLRAETLDGAIIDECRQQKKETWTQIIMPMLGRFNGWCDFLSTSNGFDWFYDLFQDAKLINPNNEWATFHAPSTECWWWTPEQIATAKSTMSESEFRQEILAEFVDLHRGKAYLSFGAHNHLEKSPFVSDGSLISPYLPILIGLDFNVNPMHWTIGQQRNDDFYWFDEIHVANTNTQECARELIAKLGEHKMGVVLCGDASGNSRHTSASESDYVIICQALDAAKMKWTNRTPDSNPSVKERVNTVNAKLKSADGTIHMWLHPTRCPHLKRDFERVSWKQGAQTILDQQTDPSLTHASDSVGYPVVALTPMQVVGAVGVSRVIFR